jgi:hypothetical protein
MIDMVINMGVGRNYMPSPDDDQGMYDALIQRERSGHFMNIQRATFANNSLFSRMGISSNGATKFMGGLMGSPDSAAANMLSPIIGGNPMAAGMHLYASMAGGNMMGNFGRLSSISEQETLSAMQNASSNFYKTQSYEDQPGRPGSGIRSEIRNNVREHLQGQLKTGTKESAEYLKSLGFNGVDYDKKTGKLTDKSKAVLQQQIDDYDLTATGPSKSARSSVASNMSGDVSSMLAEADVDIQKALNERLEEQLKAFRVASTEQIEQARGSNGLLDSSKVKELFDRYTDTGMAPVSAESEAAKQSMITSVDKSIQTLRTGDQKNSARSILEESYRKMVEAKTGTPGDFAKAGGDFKDILANMQKQGLLKPEQIKTVLTKDGTGVDTQRARDFIDKAIYSPQDKAQRAAASANLEKILVDNKVITKTDLGSLRNKEGVIDAEKAQAKLKEFGVQMDQFTGSSESDRLASQRYIKNRLAGKTRRAMEELEAYDSEYDDESVKKKANQKILDILKNQTPGEGYNLSEEQLKARQIINKKGEVDLTKVERIVAQNAAPTYLEQQKKLDEAAQKMGMRYSGINFENSRGFKFEELERGFAKASELRLIGDRRGGDVGQAMGDFYKNSGGVMSAARSLFGNKDGGALVQDISSMLGSSAKDMTSTEGAQEMEQLLRKVKATARVAGVGINTMMQIIESTKDLAKSNPQLQYMNAGASTDMALKAVGSAAQLGRFMRPDEYRGAGGAQGIAAGEIKGGLAFAQSGMGQFQSSMLAIAKTPEQKQKLKEMFEAGLTGTDLESGKMEEIADILGMSVDDVQRAGSNPLLARRGMKNDENAKIVTGKAAEEGAIKAFYQGFINTEGGDIQEKLEAEFKTFEGSYSDFANQRIIPNLNKDGQEMYEKYGDSFLRKRFIRSRMSETEQKEFDAEVERQTKRDTEISKKLDAAHAPLITQAVSALGEGKTFEGAAEAIGNILATPDYQSQKIKDIMTQARSSAGQLFKMSESFDDDEMLIKDGKFADELNSVLQAQRSAAAAKLEEGSGATAAEKAEAKKLLESGVGSRKFTGEEFKAAADFARAQGGTAEEQLRRLGTLEKKGSARNANEEEEYNQLKNLKEMHLLSSGENYEKLKENKGLRATAAGVIQSEASSKIRAAMDEIKANEEDKLYSGLKLETGAGGDKQIAAAIANFGGDEKKMVEAYRQSREKPDDKNNYFNREENKEIKKSIGDRVRQTDESIQQIQIAKQEEAAGKPKDSAVELTKVIDNLIKAINTGSLTTSIKDLATALKT